MENETRRFDWSKRREATTERQETTNQSRKVTTKLSPTNTTVSCPVSSVGGFWSFNTGLDNLQP